MNVSHDWLRALVPHALSPAQLRDLLTSRVATVEELIPLRADLAPIVVARVVEAGRHPDSDHLWVTRVDAGNGEPLDVVCGAPNVQAGKLYPFAPTGTMMPGGLKIEKRKIRGQWSNGMLCSARELGLGENHEGILELDADVRPGTPFLQAVPAGDTRLVVDVLPNRPDLLSHLGVAREVAAALGLTVALPPFDGAPERIPEPVAAKGGGSTAGVTVRVEDPSLAPRYLGVVVRGVKIGPSPDWLVARLAGVGVRSINNVVDATNYVLHELGQPTHAFDLAKLRGGEVVVRPARKGETLVTLDGTTRTLDERITVIADAAGPQAVAGVMGGRESEVTPETTDLFVEVAIFDPRRTRAARRALGLSTDASYRFERTIDPELPPRALARVASLVIALAGGAIDGAPMDVSAPRKAPSSVALRTQRVRRLLGEPVPAGDIRRLLGAIGFETSFAPGTEMLVGEEELSVLPPSWRADVVDEIDLVEEVARLVGYDAFPNELRPARPSAVPDAPQWKLAAALREELVGLGLFEVRPIPFVRGGDGKQWVRVLNPIAENESFLRRELLDTLSRRAEHNLTRMQGDVRIFEIGNVFEAAAGSLPVEELRVAAVVMGARRPPHFTESKPPAYDEWDAKALAERIVHVAWPDASLELAPTDGDVLWNVMVDGKRAGAVRRLTLDAPVWASPAFGVEIGLGRVSSERVAVPGRNAYVAGGQVEQRKHPQYRPIPATPAVEFDLALVVPNDRSAAAVEEVLRRGAGELLERLVLFDEYRGKGVAEGARSLAWRLTLRHPERTLRDKEVEGRREKLLKLLENELGIRQRTA